MQTAALSKNEGLQPTTNNQQQRKNTWQTADKEQTQTNTQTNIAQQTTINHNKEIITTYTCTTNNYQQQ